jgi:hypothetical protein
MSPTKFDQANVRFGPPPELSDSQCLTIYGYSGTIAGGNLDGSPVVVTAWKPAPEDIVRIQAGEPVYLTFIGGLPPHMASTDFNQAINPGS